jgi:hypothetical protein
MPFTITATNNNKDVVSFHRDTAAGALEKCLELERGGFQTIIVKDDKGRGLSRDQLERLYQPKKTS